LSEPALYVLLTFQVPNLMSVFFSLGHLSKESVQVRDYLQIFVTSLYFTVRSCLASRPTPKLEDYPFRLFVTACSMYTQLFGSSHLLQTGSIWQPILL
jgi:hypothetical protein